MQHQIEQMKGPLQSIIRDLQQENTAYNREFNRVMQMSREILIEFKETVNKKHDIGIQNCSGLVSNKLITPRTFRL